MSQTKWDCEKCGKNGVVPSPKGCSKGDAFLQTTSRCLTVPPKLIDELYKTKKKASK